MTRETKPLDFDALLRLLPGYDPFATAGDCKFYPEFARKAVEFFPKYLKHVKGAKGGEPFVLEPWQQCVTANLFGWYRPNGTRRYRTMFFYVPRKCGKSPYAAGLSLYMLSQDKEPGAEIYYAAADKEQATKCFEHAVGMVEQQPLLMKKLKLYKGLGQRTIKYDAENSYIKVLSSDVAGKHGGNAHVVVVDEVHAHKNRELIDVLASSVSGRRQPMIIYLTTADYDRPSICNELLEYARTVRDNGGDKAKPGYDPYYLPVLYEATAKDDWTSPAVWARANPNLGVSKNLDYMESECRKALQQPTREAAFKRFELNLCTPVISIRIPMESWDASAGAESWKEKGERLEGQVAYAGFDIGAVSDLTALCLVFPRDNESEGEPEGDQQASLISGGMGAKAYDALWWFWCAEKRAAEIDRRANAPYITWARQGLMTLTDGDETDYNAVRRDVRAICEKYNVQEFGMDRAFEGRGLSHDFMDDGIKVVAFGMGFLSMAAPGRELESLLARKAFNHGGNPVARWMFGNTVWVEDDAGNIKPSKRRSVGEGGKGKIDGITAALIALGRALMQETSQSVYDSGESLGL